MKYTKCPVCNFLMVDNERSIRFRCSRCGHEFDYKQELHKALAEAFRKDDKYARSESY